MQNQKRLKGEKKNGGKRREKDKEILYRQRNMKIEKVEFGKKEKNVEEEKKRENRNRKVKVIRQEQNR